MLTMQKKGSFSVTKSYLQQTFDFFGELDSLRVCERATLVVNVSNVKDFTHEFYDWLRLVKRSGGHWWQNEEPVEPQRVQEVFI